MNVFLLAGLLIFISLGVCFAEECRHHETPYECQIREEIERRHEIMLEEKRLEVIARLERLKSQNINVSNFVGVRQRVNNKSESEATNN